MRASEDARGLSHVPIIAFTAASKEDSLERCRAAGMNDVLTKPAHLSVFRERLGLYLHAEHGT